MGGYDATLTVKESVESIKKFALSNNFANFISDFYCTEKMCIELNKEDEIIKSAAFVNVQAVSTI